MEVKKLVLGVYQTNCYILVKQNNCVIIDPSGNYDKIVKTVDDLKVEAILLTHGHFDHIGAVDKLVSIYQCDVYLNPNDIALVNNPNLNSINGVKATMFTKTKELLEPALHLKDFDFEVFYTPGHTMGSTLLKIDQLLFTGDTLFKDSIGRTDFPYSSRSKMQQAIKLIKTLSPDLFVYPGHGPATTLKAEFENNYYLR